MKFKSGLEKATYLKEALLNVLKTMGYLSVADYKRICHIYPIEPKDYVRGWHILHNAHFNFNESDKGKVYIEKAPSTLIRARVDAIDIVGNIPSLGNVHICDYNIEKILVIHMGLACDDLQQWRHYNRKILVFDSEPMKQHFIQWFDNHYSQPGEDVVMVGKDFDLKSVLREHGLIVREVI